ncbi:glutathione S-transferase family protein [Kistimonas asteriae]|uniref:glutathione S-transferase family protein n=1 Tax=Kistimonas asteriae TaxID=517724 RepID=UPI001BA7A420|nr:glutathione S-transferase family protein [Kistimonas asteriae]
MIQVFGDSLSGNCYKIQLLLNHLAIDHNWRPVDILNGDTHTARFLELNANGKIPVVVLEDGRLLAESNAILNYFAEGTDYLPNDRYQRAKVLEWQFFEQYSHEPYIAVARFIARYQGMPESRQEEFQSKQVGGYKALEVMEQQLGVSPYLAGTTLSIADISLFAYTHVAHEGGFNLQRFPAIRRWIEAVESHPKHMPMQITEHTTS